MSEAPTIETVRRAITRAKDNGEDFDKLTAWQVAVDLCYYDIEFEGCDLNEICGLVIKTRDAR